MPEEQTHGNGWRDKFILSELERNTEGLVNVNATLVTMRVEIAKLKLTAGFWGAVAGAIPSLAAVLWMIFSN